MSRPWNSFRTSKLLPRTNTYRTMKMHSFLIPILTFIASLSANGATPKPNVIIVFCDDLGYADIGPFGSKTHATPVLDRMAKEGMRLTDFYSTCPVCTPSRSSLMTGCYPRRVNMHVDEKNLCVLFPAARKGLNPSRERLRRSSRIRDTPPPASGSGTWETIRTSCPQTMASILISGFLTATT